MSDETENTNKDNETATDTNLTRNRRRMAWYFTFASTILTLIMIFYVPAANVAMYDSIYATFLFLSGSVILGYLGTSAVMTYYNRK